LELIEKYFPELTALQKQQFSSLDALYPSWNEKINLISRKDIEHLYERHVLHSLSIAKFISFKSGVKILDVGTGGGFPGIPLAIYFPEVKFHLIDSIGKKITVVKAVADSLELKNVSAEKIRAEELKGQFDFVVSRAVDSLKSIYDWTKHLMKRDKIIAKDPIAHHDHGWIFLKGGDLKKEIEELEQEVVTKPVSDFFEEEFFKEKFIVYFQ
jgi:16S rRNA (guanine527-N7)-methyltransferase